jgi:hypothetical protein
MMSTIGRLSIPRSRFSLSGNLPASRSIQRRGPRSSGQRFLASSSVGKKDDRIGVLYPLVGGLVVTVAGGIKYFHDHFEGTDGLIRSATFFRFAVPKYLEYRRHTYQKSPDEVWDELDKETAARALDLAYDLEGFYYKGGQMVAANMGGAFPQIWQDTMSVLQDQVPPQEFSVIKKIVESELDFDKVFATFEETTIGSAAIGQVHRATLRNGTP